MKYILIVLLFIYAGCSHPDKGNLIDHKISGYWVSRHLEPYAMDASLGGGQTLYGSGYLLVLDSNNKMASLGADYYWNNDSLYQGGEPGMTVKLVSGKWNIKTCYLIKN